MRILIDTQILIWAADADHPDVLPCDARRLIEDHSNRLFFSAVSIWEVALKARKLDIDPRQFRHALLDAGYEEVAVTGQHAAAVDLLPRIHADPFDRLLVAQSQIAGLTLLTADATLGRYPGSILAVERS
ncbi:MAG: type II toxin-antitoxin system VapC family toxin [bacterium]|nr:type II toxin-antitoxin system VapC family toxin [bacterium]MCY3952849.1 type II toxin-antitoxin system VapC family toxin [bacterium]MCY4104768.1 type II toxin-antitoxin system VapC family toxin [bacterium]